MKLIRVRSDDSVEMISVPKIFSDTMTVSTVEIYQEKYKLHAVVATCYTMINGIKLITLYNKELSVVGEYNGTGLTATTGTALMDAGEINVDDKVQHIVILCTSKNAKPAKIMIDGMKISLSDADIKNLKSSGTLVSLTYNNDMQLFKVYSNGVASKAYLLCYNNANQTIVKTIGLMNLSGELVYNYDVTVNTPYII